MTKNNISNNTASVSSSTHDVLLRNESETTSEQQVKTSYQVQDDDYIIIYADKILSGEIVASKRIKKVYTELRERIINPDPNSPYKFDKEKANRPIEFIETFIKHSKGEKAREPFIPELFQRAVLHATFGFVHKDTGYRQYREVFYLISRKHGKTALASAISLYMLLADGEEGAEIYITATKKEQAYKTFEQSYDYVRLNKHLNKNIKKRVSDLYFSKTFSKIQPLSSDSKTLDGLNISCAILDEVHEWRDKGLYEVIKTGISSRKQPLIFITTTSGHLRESVFDDLYKYACNVADGNFKDDSLLPILYEQDNKMEYLDPLQWAKSNPSLDGIKSREYLVQQLERAKNNPSDLKGILTKDFNVLETSSSVWLSYDDINNESTFDIKDFNGFYAIGGLDLSISDDLTVATLLMIDKTTEIKYVHQMAFLPDYGFKERVAVDQVPYDKWLERGFLTLCEGNQVNYTEVISWFEEMVQEYNIKIAWLKYDRYQAGYLAQEFKNRGINAEGVAQGSRTLSTPMKKLGADLKAKKVNYNNNPILKWCLMNTGVKSDDNDNIRPIKAMSDKHKIDALSSLLDAYVGLHENYREFNNAQPNITIEANNIHDNRIPESDSIHAETNNIDTFPANNIKKNNSPLTDNSIKNET